MFVTILEVFSVQILFEDEYLLIVNKPSDLLVHHSHYARNIDELSLVELLNDLGKKVYPVHRLDRKTSGVLICVKEKAYEFWKDRVS